MAGAAPGRPEEKPGKIAGLRHSRPARPGPGAGSVDAGAVFETGQGAGGRAADPCSTGRGPSSRLAELPARRRRAIPYWTIRAGPSGAPAGLPSSIRAGAKPGRLRDRRQGPRGADVILADSRRGERAGYGGLSEIPFGSGYERRGAGGPDGGGEGQGGGGEAQPGGAWRKRGGSEIVCAGRRVLCAAWRRGGAGSGSVDGGGLVRAGAVRDWRPARPVSRPTMAIPARPLSSGPGWPGWALAGRLRRGAGRSGGERRRWRRRAGPGGSDPGRNPPGLPPGACRLSGRPRQCAGAGAVRQAGRTPRAHCRAIRRQSRAVRAGAGGAVSRLAGWSGPGGLALAMLYRAPALAILAPGGFGNPVTGRGGSRLATGAGGPNSPRWPALAGARAGGFEGPQIFYGARAINA